MRTITREAHYNRNVGDDMDSLTHAIVGGSIGVAISTYYTGSIEPVFVFNGILFAEIADFDILQSIKNPAKKMKYHRSGSHSLFVFPIIVLFACLAIAFFGKYNFFMLYLTGFLAYLSHIGLDLLNSYGTKIFWPFSRKRYAMDILPIWDRWILIIFLC